MTVKMPTAADALAALEATADPVRAAGAMRYFKTGPGEYGEGTCIELTLPIAGPSPLT